MTKQNELAGTKRLMAALGRMSPKPHDQMKIGKSKAKSVKSPARKRASAKPKSA